MKALQAFIKKQKIIVIMKHVGRPVGPSFM